MEQKHYKAIVSYSILKDGCGHNCDTCVFSIRNQEQLLIGCMIIHIFADHIWNDMRLFCCTRDSDVFWKKIVRFLIEGKLLG